MKKLILFLSMLAALPALGASPSFNGGRWDNFTIGGTTQITGTLQAAPGGTIIGTDPTAQATANSGTTAAATAQATANSALTSATAAQAAANSGTTAAAAAQATANSALTSATAAQATANGREPSHSSYPVATATVAGGSVVKADCTAADIRFNQFSGTGVTLTGTHGTDFTVSQAGLYLVSLRVSVNDSGASTADYSMQAIAAHGSFQDIIATGILRVTDGFCPLLGSTFLRLTVGEVLKIQTICEYSAPTSDVELNSMNALLPGQYDLLIQKISD